MNNVLIALLTLIATATAASAADTLSAGVRAGASAGRSGYSIGGSPVAVAGLEYSLLPFVFLNAEYRRQFDDKLNFIAGGVGVRF